MSESGFIHEYRGKAWGRRFGTALLTLGALAVSAAVVRSKTSRAERLHPPIGQFIEVDGVRLHYVERGTGQPVLLLHGNGAMAEDFDISGLLDKVAHRYRAIAFDRPGYGHSGRPRDRAWTPIAQAQLLHRALQKIGVERAIVVGHSWGTLVALAMALEFPSSVKSLVLLSGYYYPSLRLDAALSSPPAIPVLGDLMRYTISPLLGRLMWPMTLRRLFGPSPAPKRFKEFPVWMALRPSQLRANATESALMPASAMTLSRRYGELAMPVVVLAGTADRVADAYENSARLHEELQHSHLRLEPGVGHMVHYLAPDQVLAAIDTGDDAAMALQPVVESEHGAAAEAHLGRA